MKYVKLGLSVAFLFLLFACTPIDLRLGQANTQFFNSGEPILLKVPLYSSSDSPLTITWTQDLGKKVMFGTKQENGFAILMLEPQTTTTQLYFKFNLSTKTQGQTLSQAYDFMVVNAQQFKAVPTFSLNYSQSKKPHNCSPISWQTNNQEPPLLLSETGCIEVTNPLELPAGAYPYEVQRPFWSDGASKYRWFFLPENQKITLPDNIHKGLGFPPGSILVKHFSLGGKSIETRLLLHSFEGDWLGYSYEWNEAQTEAYLLKSEKDRQIGEQVWHYPSRSECFQCHTFGAAYTLGTNLLNLNVMTKSGDLPQSQLFNLRNLGVFANEVPFQAHFANSDNEAVSVNRQAREYLEVNCSGCHRPDAPAGRAQLNFLSTTPLAKTHACNVSSWIDDLGLADALIISPGKPENSILLKRLSSRGTYQMPPLGSNLVPEEGAQLIEHWIKSLKSCD